jgi:hypothetical protein
MRVVLGPVDRDVAFQWDDHPLDPDCCQAEVAFRQRPDPEQRTVPEPRTWGNNCIPALSAKRVAREDPLWHFPDLSSGGIRG